MKRNGVVEQRQPPNRIRVSIQFCANSLSAIIDRHAGFSDPRVYFSSKGFSVQLNGSFLNSVVRQILKGKGYPTVDIIVPIIVAYIDRANLFLK